MSTYADPKNWGESTVGHGMSATVAFSEPGDPCASGWWLANETLYTAWRRPLPSKATPTRVVEDLTNSVLEEIIKRLKKLT